MEIKKLKINNLDARPASPAGGRYFLDAKHGFTLIELVIVVAIIAILSSVLLLSNFSNYLKKSRDGKRKIDMNKLVRVMEEYYNENQRYPTGNSGKILDIAWGRPWPGYVPILPQDPLAPFHQYYYDTTNSTRNYYVIYTLLEIKTDPDIANVGCTGGCGPGKGYNYAVFSTNVHIDSNGLAVAQ